MPPALAIAAPIVLGFIIGAGTNQLAIVMLFRPYKRRRIFGVPFHGIFPRLQPQLAGAAGDLVEAEFFSVEAVRHHLEQANTKAAIRGAIAPLVNDLLNTPLGTPNAILEKWAPKGAAAALKRQAERVIEDAIDRQFRSADGRQQVRDLIAGQIVTVLRQPLREILDAAAPLDDLRADPHIDAEVAAAQSPDSSVPEPPEVTEAADPHALLRRLLRLPDLMDWLADSELPAQLARGATQMVFESVRQTPRLQNLMPADAAKSLVDVAQQFAPDLQEILADSFTKGSLRGHVLHEARKGAQEFVERRLTPDNFFGRMIPGDILLGWVDGIIEKLPDHLAAVVKSPGAGRAMRDVLRSVVQEFLRHPPERLTDKIYEQMGENLAEWAHEWLRDGLRSTLLQTQVQRSVLPELSRWLSRPAGDVLAKFWPNSNSHDSLDAAAIAESDGDEVATDDAATIAARDWKTACRIAEQIMEQMHPEAIAKALDDVIDAQIENLFEQPLGTLREMFGRNAEPRREAAEIAAHEGDPTDEDVTHFLTDRLTELAKSRVVDALAAMKIRDLVAENIAAWPPQKLEEAILQIARKHLRFVTWVGGFLGAMIGGLQVLLNFLT